jgi:ribosomal protein S18 acetylase RimI-like enzyme
MENNLTENIIIRDFIPSDKELVGEFFDQMGDESRAFFNRGDFNRNRAMSFFCGTPKNTKFCLAEYEGRMVGYVFIWDTDTMLPWLGIAVREEFKGRHLGRRLISHMVDFAKENGKGGIMLTTGVSNFRAQALYEHMGFMRMGIHTSGEVLYLLRF